MTPSKHHIITIWDSIGTIPEGESGYYWSGYNHKQHGISLLSILEENSDSLRELFFKIRADFITRFCHIHTPFKDPSKVEYLILSMSKLVESCFLKSSSLLNVFLLLSLDKVLKNKDFKKLKYVGAQTAVAESLLEYCYQKDLEFHWEKIYIQNEDTILKKIWKKLPNPIRALIWLLQYILQHWPLRKLERPEWFKGKKAVFIFSYFAHLDKESCESGHHHSRQWEDFPKLMRKMGRMMNWGHFFLKSKVVPDTQTGINWLKNFNTNPNEQGTHTFLDTFLDLKIVSKVIFDWLRIQFLYIKIGHKIKFSIKNQSFKWLWPILKKDWTDSMIGIIAVNNILFIHLFDKLFGALPKQNNGYYLSENQSWERAFLHSWRKHGHGEIVGIAHSTIRYWDLKYYDTSIKTILPKLPKPNILAINGSAAFKNLSKAKYPMEKCIMVEALRYLYLNKIRLFNIREKTFQKERKLNLLILGDIKKGTTHRLMKTMENAFERKNLQYEVWIKPHPHNNIELSNYPKLESKIMDLPLLDLLPKTHIAFSSVFTSAAVDSFCAGIPVINYLDCHDLNYSSMRGFVGINYVSTTGQLLEALENIHSFCYDKLKPEDFFLLDEKLIRWEALLNG